MEYIENEIDVSEYVENMWENFCLDSLQDTDLQDTVQQLITEGHTRKQIIKVMRNIYFTIERDYHVPAGAIDGIPVDDNGFRYVWMCVDETSLKYALKNKL